MNQSPQIDTDFLSLRYTINNGVLIQGFKQHKRETGLSNDQIVRAAITEYLSNEGRIEFS